MRKVTPLNFGQLDAYQVFAPDDIDAFFNEL